MPLSPSSNQGNLAAALAASAQLASEHLNGSHGDEASATGARVPADAATRADRSNSPEPRMTPRYATAAPARAGMALIAQGINPGKPSRHGLSALKAMKTSMRSAAKAYAAAARAACAAEPGGLTLPEKILATAASTKKKMLAKIFMLQPAGAAPQRSASALASARPPASGATSDASSHADLATLPPRLADEVASHMLGRPHESAEPYLAVLAARQAQQGHADLTALAAALSQAAPWPADDGGRPEIELARQASASWLLADYLQNDFRPADVSEARAQERAHFIPRLNAHIDGVLDAMQPDALWTLYRRVMTDGALTVPLQAAAAANPAGPLYNAAGPSVARGAWAVSQVCSLAGRPLAGPDADVALRAAIARHKTDAAYEPVAIAGDAAELQRLTLDRAQYLLMRQLRVRAERLLRQKGFPINELIGIAATVRPENGYARGVAGALRRTLASPSGLAAGMAPRYPSDESIRRRLGADLDLLSDSELRIAADWLLSERTGHMKRLVESQGADAADHAAYGRQFTILCDVLARKLVDRFGDSSGMRAVDALRVWDWDSRFSHGAPAPRPGRIARIRDAMHRGMQRMSFILFPSDKSRTTRIKAAYDDVVRAASGFIEAIDGPQGRLDPQALRRFGRSGARLVQAARHYQALWNTPEGRLARWRLGLPQDAAQLLDLAFRDAVGKLPGARVNVLGQACRDNEWLGMLHGLLQMQHDIHEAGPHPSGSIPGRLFNRMHRPEAPPLALSDAKVFAAAMRNALTQEAGNRAAAEVLRVLGTYCGGAAAGDRLAAAEDTRPTENDLRMLRDIRLLEQRFRPLEAAAPGAPAEPGVDRALDRFINGGLTHLSPEEAEQVTDAVLNLDHRPQAWLEQDELWNAVIRCSQKRRTSGDATGRPAAAVQVRSYTTKSYS